MSRLVPAHTLRPGDHFLLVDEDAQPLVRVLRVEAADAAEATAETDSDEGDEDAGPAKTVPPATASAVRLLVALPPFEDKTLRVELAPNDLVRIATTKRFRAQALTLPTPTHAADKPTHATPVLVAGPAPYSILRIQLWVDHPLHDAVVKAVVAADAAAASDVAAVAFDVVVAHTRPPIDAPGDRARTAFVAYAPLDAHLQLRHTSPDTPRIWAP